MVIISIVSIISINYAKVFVVTISISAFRVALWPLIHHSILPSLYFSDINNRNYRFTFLDG